MPPSGQMRCARLQALGIALVISSACGAPKPTSAPPQQPKSTWTAATLVAQRYARHAVTGAFVLLKREASGHWTSIAQTKHAHARVRPASSFKIFNTLIGLETGVINASSVFTWDGEPRALSRWEQDLPLAEALQASCVPCYQAMAREVGLSRMRHWLGKLGYGNRNPGQVIDRFWLDGPLTISAAEQAKLVAQLVDERLPASATNQRTVKDALFVEALGSAKLYAKSGWTDSVDPQIGWYVGYVEGPRGVYAFATLARAPGTQAPMADAVVEANRLIPLRKPLTLQLLRDFRAL